MRRGVKVREPLGSSVGIESEQLVFDYLSRIGDLAHGTAMSAAERARLVSRVRADIDRRRAESGGADTVAGVRRILDGIGRPEDVVARTGVAVPQPRAPRPAAGRSGRTGSGGPAGPAGAQGPSAPPPAASSPHLVGSGERGSPEGDSDWWRSPPAGRYAPGGQVPVGGFTGGIELPEVLKPPPDPERERAAAGKAAGAPLPGTPAGEAVEAADEGVAREAPAASRRPWTRLLRPRAAGAAGGGRVPRRGGAVELLAAALLVAGAVVGSLVPLGLGWLAAWWSPRLSRQEAKRAVAVVPGAVAAAGLVWLWGRTEGRWGEPIARGALGDELAASWPWALRAAAVAGALYLLWRARRPRG
ncbi:hypothetical protein [Streptomyces sp. URMC 125]|uniref:hypothetical protein n=1 Tax=Streptomyces sp. URMC 125 TaxID=3423419 RepID=UPI003F1BAAA7